ncbi:CRISPR-associated protein Cas4 [Desulfurococcus mucosus]|uniref:CRISPR-associated protein Cas4 n=1 Tax=Desulfurococcus mucosus TaxID=2275 RepID=UPI000ADEB7EC|nr:CRISPR-associated protein Cas4 [Desulfurococcus mucosus]
MRGSWLLVRDLEEYFFCPFAFYLSRVAGEARAPGLWSEVGKDVQAELSSHVESRYKVIGREVFLESVRLRLRGRVDYVVELHGLPAPLEVKHSRRLRPWWKYTLVAYAMLAEEKYSKPVKQALLILPGPREIRLEVASEDRRRVEEALTAATAILEGRLTPRPYESRSCINCDYSAACRLLRS